MFADLLRFLRNKADTPFRIIGMVSVYLAYAMVAESPVYEPEIAHHEDFLKPLAGMGIVYWLTMELWSWASKSGMYPATHLEVDNLRKKVRTIGDRQGRLADTISEAYWESDASGKMIFANGAYAALYGTTARELIRSGTAPYIHKHDLQDTYRMFQQARAGRMGFSVEFEVVHKGVSVRALRVYAWPLFDDNDNFEGHFGSAEIVQEFEDGDY